MGIFNVKELKKIILHTPGNIYLKDCLGHYLLCNNNQLKIVGLTLLDEIVNKTDYDLYSKDVADRVRKVDVAILESKVESTLEEMGVDAHGNPAVYLTKKIPLFDKDGVVYGLLGVSLDITESKNNERLKAESEKNAQILKEMQAKLDGMTQVSACVAHELRTPLATIRVGLNSIKQYLPLLLDAYEKAYQANLDIQKVKPQIFKLLDEVPESLQRVTQSAFLFIDMLLMNLEPSFKPATEHNVFYIHECIAEAIETYPGSEEEKMLLNWQPDNNPNFVVQGKMVLIKHVLYNLIKNSLYSIASVGKGEIQIWTQTGKSYNTLYFKDTGSGIAPNILSKIFERFYSQVDYGAGIGLTYCKMVMEAIEGVIFCESTEGEYALFKLEFPVFQE